MKIDESQLKYAFEMFDANHDGKLNIEEMKQMLVNIGLDVSDKIINKIIKEASKSGMFCLDSWSFFFTFTFISFI